MYGGTPYYSELGWNQEEGEFNTASRWDGSMVCSIVFNGKTLLASWVNKAGSASNASWERTRLTIAVRSYLGTRWAILTNSLASLARSSP